MRIVASVIVFCSIAVLLTCSRGAPTNTNNTRAPRVEKGDKEQKDQDNAQANTRTDQTSPGSATCDKSLWDHVYNPERLEVKKECIAVTGTIAERSTDDDGDEHMLLKLDDGQDDLLTKKNAKKKDGNLVIEA